MKCDSEIVHIMVLEVMTS